MSSQHKYSDPPWVFKGRAIYQLQLVKLAEARKHIPNDLSIVSFFGYTLGGFYLARYDHSPAGPFDECVALAGIVWNKPTSCAWAARVYVNNREARHHGRQHVGLPSRICSFSQRRNGDERASQDWWDQPRATKTGKDGRASNPAAALSMEAAEPISLTNDEKRLSWRPWGRSRRDEGFSGPLCFFSGFPSGHTRVGPRIKLTLPSFSGRTPNCPGMLRYACLLSTNVRLVPPLLVSCRGEPEGDEQRSLEDLSGILGGKPVLSLAFDRMEMTVHKPVDVFSREDDWELQSPKKVPQLLSS